MKTFGIVLVVVGIFGLYVALTMDTSYRGVANLSLMNMQRNTVSVFIAIAVVGAGIWLTNRKKQQPLKQAEGAEGRGTYRACPFCAEEIRTDAILCRFCKSSINQEDVASVKPAPTNQGTTVPSALNGAEHVPLCRTPTTVEKVIAACLIAAGILMGIQGAGDDGYSAIGAMLFIWGACAFMEHRNKLQRWGLGFLLGFFLGGILVAVATSS